MIDKDAIKTLIVEAIRFEYNPPLAGVYILYNQNEVIYVGQSENVVGRVMAHQDKQFDFYKVIPIRTKKDREYLERILIEFFFPIYNVDLLTLKVKKELEDRNELLRDTISMLREGKEIGEV